jgi:hypothetical protein
LRVNNVAVKTWTLSKNTTETVVQTTLNGKVTLHFTNDTATNDVQVDYVNVNGNLRQAKYQPINTGVYQGNACGGVGPNGTGRSEWLNCNGYIDFDATTTVVNQPIEIVVRARGTGGGEKVQLLTGNTIAKEWTLTTTLSDTSITVPKSTNDVALRFINDGQGTANDVVVDYIKVNDDVRQAEDQTINTGVYQGGQCGGVGGSGPGRSEFLHCNGLINFGAMQPF